MKHKKKAKTLLTLALAIALSLAAGTSASAIYTVRQPLPDSTSVDPSGNAGPYKNTQKSAVLSENTKELHVSLDVNNGGVDILPAGSNEIAVDYDPQYYDVRLTEQNGKWSVSISGKVAKMGGTGFVRLSIPDIKRNMDVHVLNGSFRYDLPENCKDEINITAADSSLQFTSTNRFDGSGISLTAQNKDFIVYQKPVYPDYFTKTDTGFTYKSGAQTNKIAISLTGYTSVDFLETPAHKTPDSNSADQNTITVPVDIAAIMNGSFIWLGAYDFSYGDVIDYDVSAGTVWLQGLRRQKTTR